MYKRKDEEESKKKKERKRKLGMLGQSEEVAQWTHSVLIPCIMQLLCATRSSIWRRMQVTRVSELPPVCLLQKTFLLNRMSLCVPIIPRHRAHSCWSDQRSTVWD